MSIFVPFICPTVFALFIPRSTILQLSRHFKKASPVVIDTVPTHVGFQDFLKGTPPSPSSEPVPINRHGDIEVFPEGNSTLKISASLNGGKTKV